MAPDSSEDEAARLYEAFGPSLYRYAVMILAEHATAQDVVHQVFTDMLHRGFHGIHDKERYLRSAVRNACFSRLRQWRGRRTVGGEEGDQILEARVDCSQPVSREAVLALNAAIQQLSAEQREIVHCHVFEGRAFRDIAAMTGESPNTLASRYRYALERLRVLLGTGKR